MASPFSTPSTLDEWRAMALAYAFVANELRRELDKQMGLKKAVKRAFFTVLVKIMVKLT